MKRVRLFLFVGVLAIVTVASGWSQAGSSVVVPISGEYFESAAGAFLVYGGTITLTWSPAGSFSQGWPLSGSLVATAWSRNTGASYTLYGYCTDCFTGAEGTTLELEKPVLAVGYESRPAFESRIRMKLTLSDDWAPPKVEAIAFVGR